LELIKTTSTAQTTCSKIQSHVQFPPESRVERGANLGPCGPDSPRPYERAVCAPLIVSPVISRGASRPATWETSISEGGKYGQEMADPILPTACDFHGKCRDLSHAANLWHGTDGFTSPPKEGTLRILARKVRWLELGLNPRTWVPESCHQAHIPVAVL
jgi:hypothetical protein